MTLLFVYTGFALGCSFLCSILEATLLSISPSYVAHLSEERPALGGKLAELKRDVDRPLAAILSLNTIANTAGAAGIGAEATRIFGSHALGVVSAVLTLLILIAAEIVPKTLGAVHWRRIAPFATRALPVLIVSMAPLVWLARYVTQALKGRDSSPSTVSKDELAALARLGEEQGVIHSSESRILTNLFRVNELRTRDIMTPRTVMFALPEASTVGDVVPRGPIAQREGVDEPPDRGALIFSRIPVFRENKDDILGFVLKNDLLWHAARGDRAHPIADLVRPLTVVPETLPVPHLFDRLVGTRDHIALVVDEYGGVDGIVTMEDVVETLLGLEIVDEADRTVDMREMARRRWRERRIRLGMPVDTENDAARAVTDANEVAPPLPRPSERPPRG
ncbi:MAG: HlyC/CorC family transporter [Myxococcales bacterium]|nr:HlyC/CorC family transporter [Myxococcales bacterium]